MKVQGILYAATLAVVFFGLHACVDTQDEQPQPDTMAATRV